MRRLALFFVFVLVAAFAAFAHGAGLVFKTVDVYVDAGPNALGAYQFEAGYDPSALYLVGVEGGEKPFDEAPYYDPAGLSGGRIIVASFTTGEAPRGKILVARLHLALNSENAKIDNLRLTVSAGPPDAKPFPATIFFGQEGSSS